MTTLTTANFEAEVLQSSIPVFVHFWAEWCGPCKRQAPVLDRLEGRYAGKIKFAKVNVDDEAPLAASFRIMSIPTLALFEGGQVVEQLVGLRSEAELRALLDPKAGL